MFSLNLSHNRIGMKKTYLKYRFFRASVESLTSMHSDADLEIHQIQLENNVIHENKSIIRDAVCFSVS